MSSAEKPMPWWLAENWDAALAQPLLPPLNPCSVGGCDRHATIRGLCREHYRRAQRVFDPGHSASRTRRGQQAQSMKEAR